MNDILKLLNNEYTIDKIKNVLNYKRLHPVVQAAIDAELALAAIASAAAAQAVAEKDREIERLQSIASTLDKVNAALEPWQLTHHGVPTTRAVTVILQENAELRQQLAAASPVAEAPQPTENAGFWRLVNMGEVIKSRDEMRPYSPDGKWSPVDFRDWGQQHNNERVLVRRLIRVPPVPAKEAPQPGGHAEWPEGVVELGIYEDNIYELQSGKIMVQKCGTWTPTSNHGITEFDAWVNQRCRELGFWREGEATQDVDSLPVESAPADAPPPQAEPAAEQPRYLNLSSDCDCAAHEAARRDVGVPTLKEEPAETPDPLDDKHYILFRGSFRQDGEWLWDDVQSLAKAVNVLWRDFLAMKSRLRECGIVATTQKDKSC